jgi:hypothetical protein
LVDRTILTPQSAWTQRIWHQGGRTYLGHDLIRHLHRSIYKQCKYIYPSLNKLRGRLSEHPKVSETANKEKRGTILRAHTKFANFYRVNIQRFTTELCSFTIFGIINFIISWAFLRKVSALLVVIWAHSDVRHQIIGICVHSLYLCEGYRRHTDACNHNSTNKTYVLWKPLEKWKSYLYIFCYYYYYYYWFTIFKYTVLWN